jgi:hypothetical protein
MTLGAIMPIRTVVGTSLLVFALGSCDQALPDTTSACIRDVSGFTQICDLFEGTTEASGPVPLVTGLSETPGFVVLLESDKTWSDIVWFPDDGSGQASTVPLFSDPFNFTDLPFTENDVMTTATLVLEQSTDPTTFILSPFGFDDTFRIFSQSAIDVDAVPEPSTVIMLFPALTALHFASRKRAS